MDETTGNTKDKRNWRERLGIGKPGEGLPKIAGEFSPDGEDAKAPAKSAARPAPVRGPSAPAQTAGTHHHTPAKPAPMAPRATPRPVASSRPPASAASPLPAKPAVSKPALTPPPRPAAAPVSPAQLVDKLKDQREAAEKLAAQRIAQARQKAEAQAEKPSVKPKFSFIDADQPAPVATGPKPAPVIAQAPAAPRPAPAPVARPAAAPMAAAPTVVVPPAQPARRAPGPAPLPPQTQMQPPRQPLGFNPNYGQGFAPQQQTYAPPQQNFAPPPQMNMPGQGYPPQGFRPIDPATGYAPPPNFTRPPQRPMQQPVAPAYPAAQGAFRAPPRAQAPSPQPRFAESPRQPIIPMGPALSPLPDEEVFHDPPRSKRMATATQYQQAYRDEFTEDEPQRSSLGIWLVGLALAALLALGGALLYAKSGGRLNLGSLIKGGGVVEAPATPAKTTPDAAAPAPPADQSGKKQIYDRIEGDHEVPGGPLKASEQPPAVKPAGTGAAPQPPPQTGTGGGDAVPVPLPPPPGTGGQQGELIPPVGSGDKTDNVSITPAAASPAADVSQVPQSSAPVPIAAAAPAAGHEQVKPLSATTPPAAPAPSPKPVRKQVATSEDQGDQTPAPKKPAQAQSGGSDNLGSDPVVLVPPRTPVAHAAKAVPQAAPTAPAPSPVVANDSSSDLYGNTATPQATAVQKPATKQVAAAQPATAPSPPVNGYVAQLGSFASQAEASAGYKRLAATHGGIVSRYSPIIQATDVAGSTRYRLSLGPMADSSTAASVCNSLIAAGERDCLAKKQ